jgi:hypothetical protein
MRARTGFRSPTANTTGIPVYHSVEVGLQGDAGTAVPVFVCLGWAGDPSAPVEAGQSGQRAATLGPSRARDEDGTIRGTVTAQTGDAVPSGTDLTQVGTIPWLCSQAFAVLAELEAFLRGNPTLGLTGQHSEAWLQSVDSVRPLLGDRAGLAVEVDFTIGYTARI